ncbi:unnamed protein product [Effrenium voratum]|uniref:Uncharacterized protein n=1 Tax=Effrenium voratum TaxID=2562239 RepID=A0AA36MJP9_9DINO|nr:unnamed protein product [Effrenium voratum]CAJ1446633.1 unnamed protein product [Effrenium voratum]
MAGAAAYHFLMSGLPVSQPPSVEPPNDDDFGELQQSARMEVQWNPTPADLMNAADEPVEKMTPPATSLWIMLSQARPLKPSARSAPLDSSGEDYPEVPPLLALENRKTLSLEDKPRDAPKMLALQDNTPISMALEDGIPGAPEDALPGAPAAELSKDASLASLDKTSKRKTAEPAIRQPVKKPKLTFASRYCPGPELGAAKWRAARDGFETIRERLKSPSKAEDKFFKFCNSKWAGENDLDVIKKSAEELATQFLQQLPGK